MSWLLRCFSALLMLLLASTAAADFPRRYDVQIHKAAGMYLPAVDWRVYKAQLWQESRLKSDAVSPVGARGLAQFMPATWAEVQRELGIKGGPHDEIAIEAGAYYMAKLRRGWKSKRPEWDRHSLALASYNAGTGNILRSQRLCGMPALYAPIMACLPRVTGKYAAETQHYAPAIWRHYERMRVAP